MDEISTTAAEAEFEALNCRLLTFSTPITSNLMLGRGLICRFTLEPRIKTAAESRSTYG